GTSYFYSWSRTNSAPSTTDSGEIIVKLDWSQLAGGSAPYDISTYTVAGVAAFVLLQTNAISDLGGHALAEFPLHLAGHSRGGSLIAEMSRLLGTNGIWVDHLTTLDPHPLNNDGNFEPFFPTDASAKHVYANVLFADDYWQNMGNNLTVPNGEAVVGAYTRQLTNLSGGYSSSHSDAHLWYHGTIGLATPASDTEASITAAERTAWWVTSEQRGTNTGFQYSLIGGGDRLSTAQPFGAGYPMIRDGYNQQWDFGAGLSSNRTLLTTNTGAWPSLIRLNCSTTNAIAQGQNLPLQFYYQWARPATSNATLAFYLDTDANSLNTNASFIGQLTVPGTGTDVKLASSSFPLVSSNATPGWHSIFAVMTAAGHSRFMYAPEKVLVIATQSLQPPTLDIGPINGSSVRVGINAVVGQTIVLQTSSNLLNWQSIATNTLSSTRWNVTNHTPAGMSSMFFRGLLGN
ncbi:MAG TPA: hypothetical protein VLT36_19065, partial [Candidatus Dormibacteraeota bacterium]|nr:hypothetical protein [Candidatus Dormibacteraeota bacterium]